MPEDIDAAINSLDTVADESVDEPTPIVAEEIDAAINSLDTVAEEPVAERTPVVAEQIDAAIASLDIAFEESVDEPTPIVAEEPESPTLDVAPVPEPETDAEEQPPAVTETLTDLVERAVADRASAVHFTGSPEGLVVRARVDGSVTELQTFSDAEAAVTAAELAMLTQTGRMTVVADEQPIELRATTVPTTLGPRTTLRVVPEEEPPPGFDDHFPEEVARVLRDAFEPLTGLVVICGSAAETRAAALRTTMRELVSPERIIFSIEDPVEHLVPGVEQTELNALAGVTHPAALQGILRSDPDVVVVGELLDPETARLAVRGARGRLVLTTLDAPTSSSAIRHLLDLGIAPWALTDAIVGIVGHAAVRRLCEACRESYYASDDELVELGRPLDERGRRLLGRSRGCHECGKTGYRDTVDLFEAFPVSIELSNVVARGASAREIEQLAESAGMRTLRSNVVDLCLDGVTPTAELPRLGLSGTP